MSGWAVRAQAGDAIVVFGVEAPGERSATIRAMQQLNIFPEPWPGAEFELTEEITSTERLLTSQPESGTP